MFFRPIRLFKFTKYAHIAEVLTLNDVLYWSGDAFFAVVLALFITRHIEGSSASTVGISYMIYRLLSSISTVSIGKLFDKKKGYLDEIWALFFVSIVAGATYISLSFFTQLWQLYLAMGIFGICRSIDINAWKMLFYSHLEPSTKGRTIGTNDAIFGVVMASMAALAGFIGDAHGFRVVVFVAGLIVIAGAFPILSLRRDESV